METICTYTKSIGLWVLNIPLWQIAPYRHCLRFGVLGLDHVSFP